jgi:hypothetical protein
MNIKDFKTTVLSIALATAFLGALDGSSAVAQDSRQRDRDRDGDGRIDSRRERLEERRGFNDGLVKGRVDAIAHRGFNSSPHRRLVSNDYRQGFQRGYAQAYRQFANNRGRRYGHG